jgi:hypothetical protein
MKSLVAEWLQSHVGTVHTFQGKENESVIFVLGGRSAGARGWAASSPNIINVAITRAKRRLYVVGNKKAWPRRPLAEHWLKRCLLAPMDARRWPSGKVRYVVWPYPLPTFLRWIIGASRPAPRMCWWTGLFLGRYW